MSLHGPQDPFALGFLCALVVGSLLALAAILRQGRRP